MHLCYEPRACISMNLFWDFLLCPIAYVSRFVPIKHCLGYNSFIIRCNLQSVRFPGLFFKVVLDILGPDHLHQNCSVAQTLEKLQRCLECATKLESYLSNFWAVLEVPARTCGKFYLLTEWDSFFKMHCTNWDPLQLNCYSTQKNLNIW